MNTQTAARDDLIARILRDRPDAVITDREGFALQVALPTRQGSKRCVIVNDALQWEAAKVGLQKSDALAAAYGSGQAQERF